MTMSLTITAAAVSDYQARLTLTVTTPTAGATIDLYRDDLSGVLVPVLGATDLLPASTVVDDVPALNRMTWYRAIASTGETAMTMASVTIYSDLPVLSDPRGGRAVQVTVAEWNETSIDSTSSSVQIDTEDPAGDAVVWLIGPDGPATATLTLRTDDGPKLAAARTILKAGRPLLLRGSQPGLEDPWFVLAGQRRERRVTNNVTDWRRYMVLPVGVLSGAPDPTSQVLGDTLGDLAAAVPGTLADIAAIWATLSDIAAADLKAM
jgi:hypothetical protein